MYQHTHFLLVLNLLLKPFNLIWSPTLGLTYKYNLYFGDIGIILTKDLTKVLSFLNIDLLYSSPKQQYIMSEFIYMIKDCKYTYLPSILTKPTGLTPKMEEFYDKLVGLVKLSIKGEIKDSVKIIPNFIPYRNRNRSIFLLDKAFGKKGQFIRTINMYDNHIDKAKKIFIKNKFNGNLVMQWIPELKPGKTLSDIMAAFKLYIEREEKELFNLYIKRTNANAIRIRFIYWHDKVLNSLNEEFNKIPF